MRIEFTAETNGAPMINTAVFHLVKGGTLTIDRDTTEYSIVGNKLTMTWSGIYIWEINGEPFYLIPDEEQALRITGLLNGSWLEFTLEDDAGKDYFVRNISWSCRTDCEAASGSGINAYRNRPDPNMNDASCSSCDGCSNEFVCFAADENKGCKWYTLL